MCRPFPTQSTSYWELLTSINKPGSFITYKRCFSSSLGLWVRWPCTYWFQRRTSFHWKTGEGIRSAMKYSPRCAIYHSRWFSKSKDTFTNFELNRIDMVRFITYFKQFSDKWWHLLVQSVMSICQILFPLYFLQTNDLDCPPSLYW